MATRSPNFGGKKWHPLFFTRSASLSENNLKLKNLFQQANPTRAQNLTSWPYSHRLATEMICVISIVKTPLLCESRAEVRIRIGPTLLGSLLFS